MFGCRRASRLLGRLLGRSVSSPSCRAASSTGPATPWLPAPSTTAATGAPQPWTTTWRWWRGGGAGARRAVRRTSPRPATRSSCCSGTGKCSASPQPPRSTRWRPQLRRRAQPLLLQQIYQLRPKLLLCKLLWRRLVFWKQRHCYPLLKKVNLHPQVRPRQQKLPVCQLLPKLLQ